MLKMGDIMPKHPNEITKLSNAFSTGNGGVNFERRIQAVFVLALLVDGFSPILHLPVQRIDFQAKHLGYDTDDLVVTAANSHKTAKLLCQMKHDLSITTNNPIFQEVLNAAWSDFCKANFNQSTDKIALITSFIAKESIHALRYIHDQAMAETSAESYMNRIKQARFTSTATREKFEVIKRCLTRANHNSPVSDHEMWMFCRCFVLVVFDMDYENSVNRILTESLINCKANQPARLVWSRLVDQCGDWNQQAATVTRDSISREIQDLFNLKPPLPFQKDVSPDFSPDSTWAVITLIGYWDEQNSSDLKAIEQLTGTEYSNFQHSCREFLINYPESLSLKNGKWRLKNRTDAFTLVREFYFDSTIKTAFQIACTFLQENSRQFTEDGQFSLMIPSTGRFQHSDSFRKGLLEGLCILSNGPKPPYCSDHLFSIESRALIRSTLDQCDWTHLVSISDTLDFLAEMNPNIYLESLEKLIQNRPTEIEKLFPKKGNYALADQNFTTPILFSLEKLAWSENHLISCVRCLGELECLHYDNTNWVNTPIHTIVQILSPFMPQTCASVEKQKHAVQGLKIDHPDLYWMVLTALLPQSGTYVTTGSAKPQYMHITIPDNVIISDSDKIDLLQFYMRQTITVAGTDLTKLAQLSKHIDYMSTEDIDTYLETIRNCSADWSDGEKCDLWIELCELKYRILSDAPDTIPDTPLYYALCSTINSICPQDIMYRHKRLYLSQFHEFHTDENHWKELEHQKDKAVCEIYSTLGLDAVIEFSISVNALSDTANRLGRHISVEGLKRTLPEYEKGECEEFYSSLIKGFLYKNGVSSIVQLDLLAFTPEFIAAVLRDAPFTSELINLIPQYLSGCEELFWETAVITPYDARYSDYDIKGVVQTLLMYHRAAAAIDALGYDIKSANIEDSLLCTILLEAPLDKSFGSVRQYSVCRIIQHLQDSDSVDIDTLCSIEYIYLPWLDRHSSTQPRAIRYKLANDADYFCELMKITYKERHQEAVKKSVPRAVSERLFQLTFQYSIVPGTDWEGNFQPDIFTAWISIVKEWAKENDRFEVTMHTVGNGLSYARFDENNIIDEAIMKELNSIENEEIRTGYRLGVFNQRGVHWVDPEGKPERALAAKYQQRADAAERLGYSRFSELLRSVASGFISEADYNACHVHEDED